MGRNIGNDEGVSNLHYGYLGRNISIGSTNESFAYGQLAPANNAQTQFVECSSGLEHHMLRDANGSVYVFGSSVYSGFNSSGSDLLIPTKIPSITNAISIHQAGRSSMIVTSDGIYAFGENLSGNLCLNQSENIITPTLITNGMTGPFTVRIAEEHSLILTGMHIITNPNPTKPK